jgi:hypothetical protein
LFSGASAPFRFMVQFTVLVSAAPIFYFTDIRRFEPAAAYSCIAAAADTMITLPTGVDNSPRHYAATDLRASSNIPSRMGKPMEVAYQALQQYPHSGQQAECIHIFHGAKRIHVAYGDHR